MSTEVRVEMARSTRAKVFANGKLAPWAQTSLTVIKRVLDMVDKPFEVKIYHRVQVPMGAGYGASGAGALGVALTLPKALGLKLTRGEAVATVSRALSLEFGWLVAPSTANTLSKVACAIDDTPVTSVVSVALGLNKPVVMVPAMHASMYTHKLIHENLSRLRSAGVHILEPRIEMDVAKLPTVEEIVDFVLGLLGSKDMVGMRMLVTAGPTIEPIDPIKIITNRSSGKMGIAVARAAVARGAEVTLIYGPGSEPLPSGVHVIRVQTTQEMRDAVLSEFNDRYDVIVSTAAAQDLKVERPHKKKLRHFETVHLKLVPAPRVINEARKFAASAFIVGFKAEYNVGDEGLLRAANDKLGEGFDMVVANDVAKPGAGFSSDTNEVIIVTSSGSRSMCSTKAEIAKAILDAAVAGLQRRH